MGREIKPGVLHAWEAHRFLTVVMASRKKIAKQLSMRLSCLTLLDGLWIQVVLNVSNKTRKARETCGLN